MKREKTMIVLGGGEGGRRAYKKSSQEGSNTDKGDMRTTKREQNCDTTEEIR